jgi:hypothetical protein
MSSRTLFAIGAIGDVVKEIQLALLANGCDPKGTDRVYGNDTSNAVKQFQMAKSLPVTGAVDDGSWQLLMQRPVPAASERSLQLTAAFEGHGFELAVGNFDGALLTWGIIGFTMSAGEVQSIVLAINAAHPELVEGAFGDNRAELLHLMTAGSGFQEQWANEHTLDHGALAEPWKSMFAAFGALPEVQAEQLKHVHDDYLDPAIRTAMKLGFTSELGLALCFDIHVQNGGIRAAVLKKLLQQSQGGGMTEPDLRSLVANAVADSARAAFREDVRRRKLTIATGGGTVHGHNYRLESWGLSSDIAATELIPAAAGRAA